MYDVASDFRYKGIICNCNHISKEEFNKFLLENWRAEYKHLMKYVNKNNRVPFEGLDYYNQELMRIYSNEDMLLWVKMLSQRFQKNLPRA